MIYAYGITQQGAYHRKKDIACQDAHKYIKCSNNTAIAAVADGLGSELYSDVASKIAVETSTQYCADRICDLNKDDDILRVICNAFTLSQDTIEKRAAEDGHDIDQYDTTLSLVVFKNGSVYFGHSGDSGIIAYTTDGMYEKVTEQQRDEDGRVFPLFFGEQKWVFGKHPKTAASIFLATDGIYELLFPVYIRNKPVDIYVALARFFMDKDLLEIEEKGEDLICQQMGEFVASISEQQVNDDKTILVLIDTSIQVNLQDEAYYKEPDWKTLRQEYEDEWRRMSYPHLYANENASPENSDNDW